MKAPKKKIVRMSRTIPELLETGKSDLYPDYPEQLYFPFTLTYGNRKTKPNDEELENRSSINIDFRSLNSEHDWQHMLLSYGTSYLFIKDFSSNKEYKFSLEDISMELILHGAYEGDALENTIKAICELYKRIENENKKDVNRLPSGSLILNNPDAYIIDCLDIPDTW